MFNPGLSHGESLTLKFTVGRKKKEVKVTKKGDRLWINFKYNKKILEEIKTVFGNRKWHGYEDPPIKQWSIADSQHNWFQLLFLSGQGVYDKYDKSLPEFVPPRQLYIKGEPVSPYDHQLEMASHFLTRHYSIFACEMGTGKTLAAMMAMETTGITNWIWVGPRSALTAVKLEFAKWDSPLKPLFITYASLKKYLEEWPTGKKAPRGVIFDESSRLKNHGAQRSQAAMHLATSIRNEHREDGYVCLMSGSPAPKSPVDWWHQCEVAMPGFIKEGTVGQFKNRLAIIEEAENPITGGIYPSLVAWLDDENKCNKCGLYSDDILHHIDYIAMGSGHTYEKSVNEVAYLYKRMQGLVLVKFKKDCLDLPDKQYRIIKCKPTRSMIRATKLIAAKSSSVIKCLTLMRELSDGFQYVETPDGTEECPLCKGTRVNVQYEYIGPEKTWDFLKSINVENLDIYESPERVILEPHEYPELYKEQAMACPTCKGNGQVTKYVRTSEQVKCPKENVLKDLLDEHDDVGRIVIYAGFTGSVERCIDIVKSRQWDYIRFDGKGCSSSISGNQEDLLRIFQDGQSDHPRIAFIGQAGAAGMGLTLTASPSIVYYSNDFNSESRIQSEDRIHRPGMDINRGATIIDIFHLPSDKYVYDNLKKKKRLQDLSLGELSILISNQTDEERVT